MKRAEMREIGAGGQVPKLVRLRQCQQRRRGGQEIVGERQDGADRAARKVPIGIVIAGGLRGLGLYLLRGRRRGNGAVRSCQPALDGRSKATDVRVEMPERQRKL